MSERVATSASRSLLLRLPESPEDGRVHSVFRRALNVTWGRDGWSTLVAPPLPLNPWSVCVPDLPSVRPGERCRVSTREIEFHDRGARVRLERAEPKDLRIRLAAAVDRSLLMARTARLRYWVCERNTPPSLLDCLRDSSARASRKRDGDPFLQQGARVIEAARHAVPPADRARHLAGLVGLGTGLTPAGDDFLVGYLAASLVFDPRSAERKRMMQILSTQARGRTTEVGARMLEAACRNEFAEPVIEIVESLARSRNGFHRAAEELLALGATSGADTLAGVLFAGSIGGLRPV